MSINGIACPYHYNDMTVKATNAGITVLNEGRFASRYNKLPTFQFNGVGAISTKDRIKKTTPKKSIKKNTTSLIKEVQDLRIIPDKKPLEKTQSKRRLYSKKSTIKRRVNAIVKAQVNKPQLYMVTISFPALTKDDICYRLFNTWLTKMRQHYKKFPYLWVCERQKNTTIHFHVLTTQWVHIKQANLYMRDSIKNMIKKKAIDWNYTSADKYNGVDLMKNKNTKKVHNLALKNNGKMLANYITKYITKNDTEVAHAVWNCSTHFSNMVTEIHLTKDEALKLIEYGSLDRDKTIISEFYTFIPWLNNPPKNLDAHFVKLNSYLLQLIGMH